MWHLLWVQRCVINTGMGGLTVGLHLPSEQNSPLASCSLEQKPGFLNSAFDGHSISGVRGRRRNFLPTHRFKEVSKADCS